MLPIFGGGQIGVCSWSLRPASPGELLESLHRLGIDAVQLALTPLVDHAGVWADAINRLRSAEIRILSGMMSMRGEDYSTLQSIVRTGGVRSDVHWPANLAHAREIAGVAARHEIHLVTFHAGFLPHSPDDPERDVLLDRLRQVVDVFETRGVSLALETGQETADTLLHCLEELARADVGVNFDPANMILYGMGDPVQALQRLAPRVRQVHVKDAIPSHVVGAWGTEVPAGRGSVDWPRFFSIAASISPLVNFIIEREAGENREPEIQAARDLIMRHLAGL